MSKRIPCNECREHKRRCSGDSPCERCQRLNLDCVYTIKKSPKDEEYIQEVEMIEQIDAMRHSIAIMEAEISNLRQKRLLIPHPSPSTASLTETDSSDGSVYSSVAGSHGIIIRDHRSASNEPPPPPIEDQKRIIARNERGYSVSVTPKEEALNWELTVQKGRLSIRTNIHNHTELLDCLQKMVTTAEFESKIPMEFGCITGGGNALSSVIRLLIWKRHGKSRFKGFVKEMVMLNKEDREPKMILPAVIESRQLVESIFWAYTRCQHLTHLSIHVPTFYELCVANGRADHSPAVLSLCAHVSLHPCRHVIEVIPKEQSRDYAAYFEERAREELCERFDEISLDVFAANINMAIYYLHLNKVEESRKYKVMAGRLSHILEQRYPTLDSGESALFHRLFHVYQRASVLSRAVRQELEKKHFNERSKHSDDFGEMMTKRRRKHTFSVQPVPGDTKQEIAYISAYQTYNILYTETFRIMESFQGTDLMNFIGVFGHQLEMAMRVWYNESLPPDFRLSLPLFDDSIPEDVFYQTLLLDTAQSTIPIITTLRVYAEYLIMVKSNLPNCYVTNHELSFGNVKSGDEQDQPRTRRHIQKLLMMRDQVDFDGPDEEYLETVFDALKIDTRRLKYSILETGVKTARCCLRIYRFLLDHPFDICLFEPRLCSDVCEILHRIAKIFLYDDREYSMKIHELMKEYLDLMREALVREPLAMRLSKKILLMEEQFNEDLGYLHPEMPSDDDLSDYLNL